MRWPNLLNVLILSIFCAQHWLITYHKGAKIHNLFKIEILLPRLIHFELEKNVCGFWKFAKIIKVQINYYHRAYTNIKWFLRGLQEKHGNEFIFFMDVSICKIDEEKYTTILKQRLYFVIVKNWHEQLLCSQLSCNNVVKVGVWVDF